MDVSAAKARVFPPVGRCIYCGGAGALTKEHIFPAGLGGGLLLPRASCTSCQREIQIFEDICMRKTLLPHRRARGLVRHPHDLPATVPLVLDLDLQGPTRVALDAHPNVLVLPGMRDLPGILAGRSPETVVQFDYKIFGHTDILDQTKRRLLDQQVVGIDLDGYAWLRMLAKIAHGYAVAELGFNRFSPALPDLILGRNPALCSYLIGNCPVPSPIPDSPPLLIIGMLCVTMGEQRLVAVNLRLFADLGVETPVYTVIAGSFTD
ncbi:hypothetical protein [Rhizobium sp. BK491]|uniref:hypothetical protein n=1 Tax=Rhizobium sp. BK491 TaxID=2587009 RepID=UPI00160F3D28|nr:hypothetical protein [Rhizobium sp. BK491]MBB3571987.1 hypothetical protein [Rhizobium sp. BK491]